MQNKGRIVNAETGLYDELNRYETAQKLKVYKDKTDGTIYTDYAITSITVTPSSVINNQKSMSGWDDHQAVQAFSTIYYTSEEVPYGLGTATAVLLTKVAWRFERSDSTVIMPTALYRYGCNGVPVSGGPYTSSQVTENNYTPVNGQTEVIVQSLGWKRILGNSQFYPSMGLYLDLTLKRGTSTWHLILSNNFAM